MKDSFQGDGVVIRVLACHSDELIREGLRLVLERLDDVEVVGEAGSRREAADAVASLRPHVVLIAADGAELEPAAVVRTLRARVPETRVVILSCPASTESVYEAARAGASGFVHAGLGGAELMNALRAVAAGGVYLSPATARRVLEEFLAIHAGPEARRVLEDLTDQEIEILRLLAYGLSNAEIGRVLYLSESTVKTHLTHIFRKLDVRDRVQAVIRAYDAGLVRPGVRPASGAPAEISEAACR
jgi:DNA-binding NarL/FixJ family response regulator